MSINRGNFEMSMANSSSLSEFVSDHQTEPALAVTYRLKEQIDLLFKLINQQQFCLKRTNRFRSYLKTTIVPNNDGNFDNEKLYSEFGKFEQDYCHLWKQCRKLSDKLLLRRRSTVATDTASMYGTLYDLLQSLTVDSSANEAQRDVICLNEANKISEQSGSLLSCQLSGCKTLHKSKEDLVIHMLEHKKEISKVSKIVSSPEKFAIMVKPSNITSNHQIQETMQTSKGVIIIKNPKMINVNELNVNSDYDNSKTTAVIESNSNIQTKTRRRKTTSKITVIKDEDSLDSETGASSSSNNVIQKKRVRRGKRTTGTKSKPKKDKSKDQIEPTRKRRNYGGKVKCDFEGCTHIAKLPYLLKQHMLVHSEERPFKCEVEGCNFRTKTAMILSNHQFTHSTDRPFKCEQCGKNYKSVALLKAHHRIHQETRFLCEYEGCGADYKDQKSFRRHIQIVHKKEVPLLQCEWPECKYSSFRPEMFRKHQNVHTGERPYKCIWPDCEKAFKNQSGLYVHNLMHKNERRYKCQWDGCSYSCNLLGNLQKHEAIHERKKEKKNSVE